MSVNKLTYNGADYDDEIIVGSGGLEMSHAMVGETLAVDTLTVPVMTASKPVLVLAANQTAGDLLYTANGKIFCARKGAPTPKFKKNAAGHYYFDGDLVGKYYMNELNRTGPREHILRFLSAIRLLDLSKHRGGLYTGQTAGEVIADIIGGVVAYTIDSVLEAIQVYGYLPVDRRRANLQMVLMAITGALKNAGDGSLLITQLVAVSAGTIDDTRVFIGGQIVEKNAATAVEVTEHNYLETDEVVELFNDTTIKTETVIFKEPPYHSLQITGGTIIESGVNFIKFLGAGAVVITGKKYTHVTRVITIGKTPTDSDEDVIRIVSNNTLLTPNNAITVAEKLYDYLKVSQSIKQEIVVSTERPGDVVSVYHPYLRTLVDACIKSMQIQFGKNELRAVCEFLISYIAPAATMGFENYVVLTGTGAWTIPEGVTRIRFISVDPGSQGNTGQNGNNGSTSGPGAGGNPGAGGDGGRIFELSMTVTPLTSKNYSCGAPGSHTIFDGISAEFGKLFPSGYLEPKSGLLLGKKGNIGLAGGSGNPGGGTVTKDGVTYNPGAYGASASLGGVTAGGGGGGGAASGGNGGTGQNGSVSQSGGYSLTFGAWAYDSATSKYGADGYNWYPDSGNLWDNGFYITITPSGTLDDVYVISGTSITHTRNHDNLGNRLGYLQTRTGNRTGSPLTYTRQYGGGGDGADGAEGEDATGYGEGGGGGDGGGGGGQSQRYPYARTGIGGDGGPGGLPAAGVIIAYF